MPHLRRQVEVATAIGGTFVVLFWALYFAANETLGLIEPEFVSFEESFVVADAVFAVLLFATAVHLHRGAAVGPFLLAMAGSMSLYLGVLDATFSLRNRVLIPPTGSALFELLICGLCIVGGIYGVRAAWTLWRMP